MAEAAEQVTAPEEPNYLDMSDEDFEKVSMLEPEQPAEAVEEVAEAEPVEQEPEVEAEASTLSEEPVEAEEQLEAEPKAELNPETAGSDAEELPPETEQSKEADTKIDYKAEYERLTAPFKANKATMQVSSVDEAIRLMQMGANYAKKMRTISPNLRYIQTLEENDLLDEDKLNFLIDLDKRKPEAIRQLVGAEGLEALGYDEKLPEYKPNAYTVGTQDVEVKQALDDIKDSPAFDQTVQVISNKLDGPSQRMLGQKPNLIPTINQHIEMGVYDHIMNIVEQQRLLGEFEGVPDLEAYRQVGDYINSQGGFDHLKNPQAAPQPGFQQQPPGAMSQAPAMNTAPPASPRSQATSQDIAERKRAAGSTRGKPAPAAPKNIDYLGMSDEEFEKKFPTL